MSYLSQHPKQRNNVRNAPTSERVHAVLNYAERLVRGQLEELSDGDRAFMIESVDQLSADLGVLRGQSSAAWSPAFANVLAHSHSMRIHPVEHGEKDSRQQVGCCDACGRREELCGYAIDLAGGDDDMNDWFATKTPAFPWEVAWGDFTQSYENAFGWNAKTRSIIRKHPQDKGRFFVGSTCLRKAKTHFTVSGLFCELAFEASVLLRDVELQIPDLSAELFTVSDDAVKGLCELLEHLKSCVADDSVEPPIVMDDKSLWECIDECRERSSGPRSEFAHAQRMRSRKSAICDSESEEGEESEESEEGEEGEDNEEDESNKRRKVMVGLNEVHAALLTDKRDTLAAHVLAAMAVLR